MQVRGLLASALGAEVTDFATLMGVALESGDARLRADALRVGLRVLDAEPELRADVLRTLDGLDDAFLAGWLTQVSRDHAEEGFEVRLPAEEHEVQQAAAVEGHERQHVEAVDDQEEDGR